MEPSSDAEAIRYLVRLGDKLPDRVGNKFKELYAEIVNFVEKLRRPFPIEWVWAVGRQIEAFQHEAYRFRFQADLPPLEASAAELRNELDGFLEKVRKVETERYELKPSVVSEAWQLLERAVELLPEETKRLRNNVGYTEELQQCLDLGRTILEKKLR